MLGDPGGLGRGEEEEEEEGGDGAVDWLGLSLGSSSWGAGALRMERGDAGGPLAPEEEEVEVQLSSSSSKGTFMQKRKAHGPAAVPKEGFKTGVWPSKRRRVATAHNLCERRRRDKFNEKIRTLQRLVPHSGKNDKASILDEVINHLKRLQSHVKMMTAAMNCSTTNFQMSSPRQYQVLPLVPPPPVQTPQVLHGLGMGPNAAAYPPHPTSSHPMHYSSFVPFPAVISCAPPPVVMAMSPVVNAVFDRAGSASNCCDSILVTSYPLGSPDLAGDGF